MSFKLNKFELVGSEMANPNLLYWAPCVEAWRWMKDMTS